MCMNSPLIRFGILEDDDHVRENLCFILDREDGLKCIGKWRDLSSARAGILEHLPNVVLVDIQLGNESGIDLIRELKPKFPLIQFMVITVFEESEKVFESLKAGATGYILKASSGSNYADCIREIARGGSPLSPAISRMVIQSFWPSEKETTLPDLTPREKEILELLAHGEMYKEVSHKLGISLDTVRTHIRHIYEKLQVRSRTEAVNKAFGIFKRS